MDDNATTETELTQTERLTYFSSASEDGLAWFEAKPEEEGGSHTIVGIDFAAFEDLGEPEVLTVTVRPGDHLNTDDDD